MRYSYVWDFFFNLGFLFYCYLKALTLYHPSTSWQKILAWSHTQGSCTLRVSDLVRTVLGREMLS